MSENITKIDSPFKWPVASGYKISDEMLTAENEGTLRFYSPLDHPEICTDLSKIGDGDDHNAIVAFARKWGLLGYERKVPLGTAFLAEVEPDLWERSDPSSDFREPVSWIAAHGSGIRVCLELLDGLKNNEQQELISYLKILSQKPLIPDESLPVILEPDCEAFSTRHGDDVALIIDIPDPDLLTCSHIDSEILEPLREDIEATNQLIISLTYGIEGRIMTSVFIGRKDEPQTFARTIIRTIINYNFAGLTPVMTSLKSDFELVFDFAALTDIIYLHLSNLTLEKVGLEKCDECGSFFPKTDPRQRYCPPDPWAVEMAKKRGKKAESNCALRHRQNKLRKRRKGKPT